MTPLAPDLIYVSRDFRAAYMAETARHEALLAGRDWRRAKRIARQIYEREVAHEMPELGTNSDRQRTGSNLQTTDKDE